MIAVVDYCKGNLKSVERGLCAVGADARITEDPDTIMRAQAIVLPGVGAFKDASDTMLASGQMQAIRSAIAKGVPFLGICLGEHLLFASGEEGVADAGGPVEVGKSAESDTQSEADGLAEGLGVMPGVVRALPAYDNQRNRYKIPHVGWNSIEFDTESSCPLLKGVHPGEYFYFTHSFIAPESPYTVATTTHSVTFPSVVWGKPHVFGVQFHPEKSSDAGAKVLANFLDVVSAKM